MSENRIQWNFNPFRTVRLDHPGEIVFMQHWHRLTGGNPYPSIDRYEIENYPHEFPVMDIFNREGGIPSERDTQVISSFILWLGTGTGQSYRAAAEVLTEKMGGRFFREDAYLAAWALENKEWQGSWQTGGYYLRRHAVVEPETLSIQDIRIMELTAKWLGADRGQQFLKAAEKSLERYHRHARELRRGAFIPG